MITKLSNRSVLDRRLERVNVGNDELVVTNVRSEFKRT